MEPVERAFTGAPFRTKILMLSTVVPERFPWRKYSMAGIVAEEDRSWS
jgi:hypothetical protein